MQTVIIETRATGINFGIVGVVLDAETGVELEATERVYPRDAIVSALEGAREIAIADGGYRIVAAADAE